MPTPHPRPHPGRPTQSPPPVWGRLDPDSQRQFARHLATLIRRLQQQHKREHRDDRA